MALWGNNDAVGSGGTVSLNYDTGVVTGTGTTFGQVGAAATGDVIRFGTRGGGGQYFGDAVIIEITSATLCTIGSTAGLSGAVISGAEFKVSQLPKFTILDSSYSAGLRTDAVLVNLPYVGTATTNADVGSSSIPVNVVGSGLLEGDTALNDGNDIGIITVGSAVATATTNATVGSSVISVVAPAGTVVGDAITNNSVSIAITSITATQISLGTTISAGISTGDSITFTGDNLIGLASTISAGISTGDQIIFKRRMGGYDKLAYGISTDTSSSYHVTHEGWVGVTTYMGTEGELRVKKEVLVAMSGINTATDGLGESIVYPTPEG